MERELFSKSFHFLQYHFQQYKHTDARGGTGVHYIGYLKSGRAHFVSETADFWAESGEFVYIPLGCRYQSFWYGTPEICFDSIAFTYYPGEKWHAPLQKVTACNALMKAYAGMDMTCGVCMHNVGALYLFLDVFLPALTIQKQDAKRILADKATAYMHAHLQEDFSVAELAHVCGVSQSGLYSVFQQVLAKTPMEVKNDMRIDSAMQYLVATDMPIGEISDRLGFHSTSYFRRVFSARHGSTPSQIRKNAKII